MDLVELRLAAYIVRWYLVIVYTLHSSDTYLQVTGDTTHINYAARQSEYLSQIVDGLRFKTAWAEALLKYWNNVFFPDRIDSDDEESPGDRVAEREDRDEACAIFRNARGSAGRASPTAGPSTTREHSQPPRRSSPSLSLSSPSVLQAGRRHTPAASRLAQRGVQEVWR
ncbi:hypothetical protein B0H14DRAFT_2559982 [Mycena olivaceomarginata]|nr:hypothetical protein B0H14DRAFT_2559982 [Mycena olivaceomarginata]